MGLCFKIASQSTAVQKDVTLNPWALLHNLQCSARWSMHILLQRWKQLVWMFPPNFFFFFSFQSRWVWISEREHKSKTVLLFRRWKALLWRIVIAAVGSMWLYLCVYVQEREPEERSRFSTEQKKKKKKSEMAGWVQRWEKKSGKMWNIYNVIRSREVTGIKSIYVSWGGTRQLLWVYKNHSNGYNIYMFYLLFYSSVLYLTFSIVITLF